MAIPTAGAREQDSLVISYEVGKSVSGAFSFCCKLFTWYYTQYTQQHATLYG